MRAQLTLMQFVGYAVATVGMVVYKFSASRLAELSAFSQLTSAHSPAPN